MTAFISRDLSDPSDFRNLLAARGWQSEGKSLVQLSPLPFQLVPAVDWIFFSSQHAVRFFFEHFAMKSRGGSKPRRDLPQALWAALGEATSKVLAEYVGQVDFVGTGRPEQTAELFRRRYAVVPLADAEAVQRILFPAARHSRQSVMSMLSLDFQCIHFEVYDNRPIAAPSPSSADVLVFTSPMNAQAYFSKNNLGKNQRVVAIGETTAGALQELGIADVKIAKEPSERGLAEAVFS